MYNIIKKYPIIAILRNTQNDILCDYAHSLYNGGIRAFEVSFSTDGASEQLAWLKGNLPPDTFIGAGTILTIEDAISAVRAGADFLLSPATSIEVLDYCKKQKIHFLPGVFTPSDVATCLAYGFDTLKLFPADSVPSHYPKNLQGPFPSAKFVAVGGVSPQNTKKYLDAGYIGVGIGSSLVDKELYTNRDWKQITSNIKLFLNL